MKKLTLLLITTAFILTNCGLYKRADVKDNPVNVKERVQKNIEEGRGIRFGKGGFGSSGTFDFASSNELWRASIDILDFVPFTNSEIKVLLIGGKRGKDLPTALNKEPNTSIMIFDEIISNSRNQINWLLTELGGELHA